MSFAQTPDGVLLLANGIDQPRRWDGLTSATENAGLQVGGYTATNSVLGTLPTVSSPGGGAATAGAYILGYRYTDDQFNPGSLSPIWTETAAGSDSFTWTLLLQSTDTRTTGIELYRSTMGEALTVYLVARVSHNGTVTSILTNGAGTPKCKITLPSTTRLTWGSQITVAGVTGGPAAQYNVIHTVQKVNSSTVVETDIGYTSDATNGGITWTLTGFSGDKRSDNELSTNGTSAPLAGLLSITNSGGVCLVTIATATLAHDLCVGDKVILAGTGVTAYERIHVVATVPSEVSFTTDVTYTSTTGAVGKWSLYGVVTNLPIYNPDGSINARQYDQPPNYRSVCVYHKDRTWWSVDTDYNEGTVGITGGTVTGVGTHFTAQMVNRYIYPVGSVVGYLITAYSSATSLTVSDTVVVVSTGTSYAIKVAPELRNGIHYSQLNLPEAVPTTNMLVVPEQGYDVGDNVALISYGPYLYILKQRAVFRLSYIRDPADDGGIFCAGNRGCCGARAWVEAEGTLYLLDTQGAWKFDGTEPETISRPIQDLFRNGTIDFSMAKWFTASWNSDEQTIRFHVAYSGDTRPKRCLTYAYTSGAWSIENMPLEVGGSCRLAISGRVRTLYGLEDDIFCSSGQGTSDVIATALRGTVTSATSSTLTDSSAAFSTTCLQAPVAIIAGTGKNQVRRISAQTSTQLTVSAVWTTTPDATSIYLVGGIEWNWKGGRMRIDGAAENAEIRVNFEPTTNAGQFDLRYYLDRSSTPENHGFSKTGEWNTTFDLGDPDCVVNTISARQLGTQVGFAKDAIDVAGDDWQETSRWLAVELRGYQGLDPVLFHEIEVVGVEAEK